MTDRRILLEHRPRHRRATASLSRLALAFLALPMMAAAQEPPFAGGTLSLEQAIAVAAARSEQIAIARAGVSRAEGEQVQARADLFPQLLSSASYDRTLATEFSGIFGNTSGPTCDPFTLRPDAPLPARVAEIERAIDCGAVGGSLFGGGSGGSGSELNLPFGRKNIWRFNLSLSQNLYTGGRVPAQRALATAGQRLAGEDLTSARAQVVLDVTLAYYDVALSERLVAIAETGLQQATATLEQTELAFKAGRSPEFEVLRARVTRDNQRPVVVRQQAQRTLAYLRLRQLLHVPHDLPIAVDANLDSPALPPPGPFPEPPPREPGGAAPPEAVPRVAVRQAEAGVAAREAAARIARSQRLPSVSFNSAYGRVAYNGVPNFSDFRTNWTLGLFAQLPIFTGGRLKGGEMVAAADLAEARAQHDRARNLAEVDTQAAYDELDAARATWEASAGTVEQAVRAFEIAELRYREGISTQLELSDARYLLEQAQANRAQAARDLQVARARIALLPDLPLGTGTLGLAGASSLATAALGNQPTAAAQPVAGQTSSPTMGAAGTSGLSPNRQPGQGGFQR